MRPAVLRPMTWVAAPCGDQFEADTVVGHYSTLVNWHGAVIWVFRRSVRGEIEGGIHRECTMIEEAQAAAQKDYLDRIAPFLEGDEDNAQAE